MNALRIGETSSVARTQSADLWHVIRLCCAVLLLALTVLPAISRAQMQQHAKPPGLDPAPESAVSAILAAFGQVRSRRYARSPWVEGRG